MRRAPDTLCYTNGGLGDELMLTAIAAAARTAGRPISVVATIPDCWRDNPAPAKTHRHLERWHYAALRGWVKTRILHLSYRNDPDRHIGRQMADHLGLTLPDGWRPTLHGFPPVARERDLVVVQNSCRGARHASTTKEWPQDRWNELTRRLVPGLRLAQLGTTRDPPLPGVIDLRGRTSLREAAVWLSRATLFIGLESGLMHLAAATRTPAVIIYGGRTLPHQTGYPFNTNISRHPPCAGCAINDGCPHALACLDIPVEEVESAVRARLAST